MKFTLHFLFFEKNDRLKSQDTFLKALEMLDKIQKEGNPKSYLLSIAIRIWKKRNRKINRTNSIAAGKYEIVYGVYPNWNKYGAEELRQMAAEIIRAGK